MCVGHGPLNTNARRIFTVLLLPCRARECTVADCEFYSGSETDLSPQLLLSHISHRDPANYFIFYIYIFSGN